MCMRTKKLTADRKAALGFLLAFAMLALLPRFVFENRGRLLDDSGWVNHTQDVIASLESALRALSDAESGIRGYVISGRDEFLDPFRAAALGVGDDVGVIKSKTRDNPAQQRRVEALRPLVKKKLEHLAAVIDARRSKGYSAAAAMVQSGQGRRLMNDVRALVAEMMAQERQLLEDRKATLAATITRGMNAFWFVTALTFIAMGVCYFLVSAYITHRRRAEEALKASAEAAQAASQAKSSFLANMSHEIRTPMTAIVGYADLLLEPGQTQSDRLDCLQTIRRNARHLLELINDVLDLSKIEAGKMTLEQITCDVPQLAAEVVSLMRPRAIEKGLAFRLTFATPVPRRATTDPLRLKQILVNLIGNAIKFTETGQVQLRVSCDLKPSALPGSSAQHATLRFDVIDTGIGISPQQMDRLFEPFQQADETMTRKFGGSGLGLTISQRLARMLGGEVTAASTPLRGSTFTITIDAGDVEAGEMIDGLDESVVTADDRPAAQAAQWAQEDTGTARLAGVRVLLAEDGLDNQRLLAAHLRRAGAEVVIAENGRIALQRVTETSPPAFDIILMDMQMPELDGYAATAELRRRGAGMPIIALTAHAMSGDREKCLAAGCSDYLAKPVEKEKLFSTMRAHLSAAPAAGPIILRSEFAADPDMQPIIRDFVAGLGEHVADLRDMRARQDREGLRRLAHELKGSGGGYGFTPITDAASPVERVILDGAPADVVAARVEELIGVVRRVEGYVEQETQREAA